MNADCSGRKAGLVAVVLACAAVAVPLGTARFEYNPAFVLSLKWWLVTLLGFVAAAAALAARSRRVSLNLLDLCVLLWQLAALLSVAFATNRDESLLSYSAMAGCGLIYIAVRRLPGSTSLESHASRIFSFLTLAATLAAAYSLLQQCGIDPLRFVAEDPGQFSATMINRNLLASFLAVVLPLELFLLLAAARPSGGSQWIVPGEGGVKAKRAGCLKAFVLILCVLCVAITSAGLATSQTRGAWAAAAVGVVVYAMLSLLHARALRRREKAACPAADESRNVLSDSGGKGIAAVSLVCAAVFSAVLVMSVNLAREEPIDFAGAVRSAVDMQSKSVRERKFAWDVAVDLIAHRPIFGCGYGTYHSAGRSFQARHMWDTPGGEVRLLPRFAHNDSLQIAAETGVCGFVCYLLVLLVVSYMITVSVISGDVGARCLVAAAAGLAVIVVHGVVHFPLYDAPTALVFWLLLGFVGKTQSVESPSRPGEKGRVAAAVCAVFLVVWGGASVCLSSMRFLGAYSFEWAARKGVEYDGANAIVLYERAVKFDPSLYQAYPEIVRWKMIDAQKVPDKDEIIALMNKALARAPNDEHLRFNYALVLERLGRPDDALQQFRLAKAANPTFGQAYTEAARVLVGANRQEEALREYAEWLSRSPADVNALFDMGVILKALGRDSEAREKWLKVLELAPDHRGARIYLGLVK